MNKNSPTKSFWIFTCSTRSYVNNIEKVLTKSVNVSISNHPSQLFIEPIMKKRLRVNTTISCFVKDGYPNPEINWELIQGPPNSFLFYNITENGSKIFINANNLPGTIWQFRCNMKSILSKTTKTINQTISFITAKNPSENCNEKCINSRISEMEETIEDNNKLHHDINQLKQIINKLSENVDKFTENMEIWKRNTNNDIGNLKESLEQKQDEMMTELKINLEQLNQTVDIWKTNTRTDIGNLKEISIINKDEWKNKFEQLNKTMQIFNEGSKYFKNKIKTVENKMIKKFFFQHQFNSGKRSKTFEWTNNSFVEISVVSRNGHHYLELIFSGKPKILTYFDISSICTFSDMTYAQIFVFNHQINYKDNNLETNTIKSPEYSNVCKDSQCQVTCSFLYSNL